MPKNDLSQESLSKVHTHTPLHSFYSLFWNSTIIFLFEVLYLFKTKNSLSSELSGSVVGLQSPTTWKWMPALYSISGDLWGKFTYNKKTCYVYSSVSFGLCIHPCDHHHNRVIETSVTLNSYSALLFHPVSSCPGTHSCTFCPYRLDCLL